MFYTYLAKHLHKKTDNNLLPKIKQFILKFSQLNYCNQMGQRLFKNIDFGNNNFVFE